MGLLDNLFGKKEASNPGSPQETETPQEQINMACAVLLLEVAEADYADNPEEIRTIIKVLEAELKLRHSDVQNLLARAKAETAGATDLFPYTHLLNQRLDHGQKCAILTSMWRVAFADGNIDKYEELLIRRAHDLLRLDHADFIAAKQAARPTQI